MTWPIHTLPDAEEELTAATEWYEAHRSGLGAELLASVDEVLDQIGERPMAYPEWAPGSRWRKARVKRFPYVIIYEIVGDIVEVTAFAHTKRNPGHWRLRIP